MHQISDNVVKGRGLMEEQPRRKPLVAGTVSGFWEEYPRIPSFPYLIPKALERFARSSAYCLLFLEE